MEYRILATETIVSLDSYLSHYLSENPDAQIIIGCDSKNRDTETVYGLVIVLYKEKKADMYYTPNKECPAYATVGRDFGGK
jgi:hypothetical protein